MTRTLEDKNSRTDGKLSPTGMMTTAQTVNVEEHFGKTNQENTRRVPSVKLTVAGAGGSVQPCLIKGGWRWWWWQMEGLQRPSSISAVCQAHQVCNGADTVRDEEPREAKAAGPRRNEEGSVKNRLFLLPVGGLISMLLGRRSNEEASVPRLRSSFFITSCAVVTPPERWLGFHHHRFR